jgi:hypothetical protein
LTESNASELLPSKYKQRHQLMLYLYDILVDILYKADEYKLSDLSVRYTNKLNEDFDFLNWLETQKDTAISEKIYIPHLFFSILKDFNYYFFESLSCIERGKVTVAFSLARKPLQDNFFYLMWMLVQPNQFIEKILYGNPEEYDVSKLKSQKDFVIDLFSKSKSLIQHQEESLDFLTDQLSPELLYDIIYNRKAPNNLTGVFDQSIHLVTTNKNYPTEKRDLNFVFADDEMWNNFFHLYYEKIPYILCYIVEVSIAIFEKYINIKPEISKINRNIRDLKKILVFYGNDREVLEDIFDIIFDNDNITLSCDECGKKYDFNSNFLNEVQNDYFFTCQNCESVERLGQYFIDNDSLLKQRYIKIYNSNNQNWKLISSNISRKEHNEKRNNN